MTIAEDDARAIEINSHRPPAFSDEALALRFAERYAERLRYVAGWSKWMIWDEGRWHPDETLESFNFARRICREAAAECNKDKLAAVLASAKTVYAVERLAKADRRLAATSDQWDADLWLLNTPGGTIDLKTGHLREHRPRDYMTKIAGVAPDPNCPPRTWFNFLERVTDGDADLAAYLQRVAGYALTGLTREHALFFAYGTGANGKSTFLNALIGCIGDYHRMAPIETFTDGRGNRHPTELAGLRGARLVTAVETEEGRPWAESKIKALTGGDKVPARFMRGDFFEFVPQFKLIIAGNHKPGLRSVDEAMRRRMNLIPFAVSIPKEERDETLPERLRDELPAILDWMVQGCLSWQQIGLAPPAAVTNATAAYLEAEDATAAWMAECCVRAPNAWERSPNVFASWTLWADRNGEERGNTKRFRDRLEARGVEHKRESGTGRTGYQGIRLRDESYGDAYGEPL